MASDAKHVIVGTAGHVDHGKTTLIEAMTGIVTDRLKEEQERGLTIDLGFASMKLPSGRVIGIVDVPGHERFLKNMLAGAGGVDIALLVVAADEGVMPQTREHVEILNLLESKQGVVALTKADMVDEEWLDMVEDDLREYLADTFLRKARIIRVSGTTGAGVDELVSEIDSLIQQVVQRPIQGPFRMPIDRVFTMTGFGTVVTGTLISGTLKIGDSARILPKGINTRVRGIQVHGKKQDEAQAGNRVAVNLVGIELSDIERGDVLLSPGYLQSSTALDVSITVPSEVSKPLTTRSRVRLHIGTAEVLGRAIVLGGQSIEPGQRGFAQFRLESPVAAARGDRFVLRLYSPMIILGGGSILDPVATKHRISDKDVIDRLQRKLKGDPVDIIEDILAIHETGLVAEEVARIVELPLDEAKAALDQLIEDQRVIRSANRFLHKVTAESMISRAKSIVATYLETNPMKFGMPKEELRRSLGRAIDSKGYAALLGLVETAGDLQVADADITLPGHVPAPGDKERQLVETIEQRYLDSGANPPLISELEAEYGSIAKDITALLLQTGELIKVDVDLLFHRQVMQSAENVLREYLTQREQITVAEFRDLISSSRKYTVPLLEYFDKIKVTKRMGDKRTLI